MIALRQFIQEEKGLNQDNLLRKFLAGFLIVNSFGKIDKKDFGKTYDKIKSEYVRVENNTDGIPTKDEFVNILNELLG